LAVDERIEVWDKDALEKVLNEGESLGQEIEDLLGDETAF
jgi:hypothetical protein